MLWERWGVMVLLVCARGRQAGHVAGGPRGRRATQPRDGGWAASKYTGAAHGFGRDFVFVSGHRQAEGEGRQRVRLRERAACTRRSMGSRRLRAAGPRLAAGAALSRPVAPRRAVREEVAFEIARARRDGRKGRICFMARRTE